MSSRLSYWLPPEQVTEERESPWEKVQVFLKTTFCCCPVAQSCLTLCDPIDCSRSGFPVFHHLLKFVQIHVHWVGNAFQPSHPLSPPSSPAFNLSQHQGLFIWVGSSNQVTNQSIGVSASVSVLPMNIQDWFPLGLTVSISLQSKGLSSIFSSTRVQKHQFFNTQPFLLSSSHNRTWLLEKP